MARVNLRHASVQFPIYNARSRSLKSTIARHAVGATIGSRPESDVVVVNELKNVTLTKFLATVGSCQQSHLPPRSKLDRPLLLPLHEPIA